MRFEWDWKWIVTTAVAGYGAALSTFNAYVAARRLRRQVSVTMSYGFLTNGPSLSDEMLFVSASNPGQRPITLTSVGLLLPDGRRMLLPVPEGTQQLPVQLSEGTNCKHWIGAQDVIRELRRTGFSGTAAVRGFYQDATDVYHNSKPFDIDLTRS